MWGDADLEEWAEEQMERIENEKEVEEEIEVQEDEIKPVKRVLRESEGAREGVVFCPGQEVRISFRVWPNLDGDIVKSIDDLTVERFASKPVAASGQSVRYEPQSIKAEPLDLEEDDLDEWLGIPAVTDAIPDYAWTQALDAALENAGEGQLILYESKGWRLELEIEAVMKLRQVIDPDAAVAAHGLNGFAQCKRISGDPRTFDKNASRHIETKSIVRPADGCIVRGEMRLLKGSVDPKPFGVEAWRGEKSVTFEVALGEGVVAEAFEATLLQCGQVGTVLRLAAAGETLLPDESEGGTSTEVEIVIEVCIFQIDESKKRETMKMSMDAKIARAEILRARGAKLWAAGRKRRAEMVWHEATRLFSFIKPEDSAFDPTDAHMKENEIGRKASIPLLLNEALAMRARGAFKDARINLDEALDYEPDHAKALFRRGQILIDLQRWDEARYDFAKCLDLSGNKHKDTSHRDLDKELSRLRRLQRRQDIKDGKYFKDAFADDRQAIYDDIDLDPNKMAKARQELRDWAKKQDQLTKQKKQGITPALKREHKTPAWDWTASYSTKDRPTLISTGTTQNSNEDDILTEDVVKIDNLQAEIEEVDEEEEDARRLAKQEYYNTQIGLGNMRIQAPN